MHDCRICVQDVVTTTWRNNWQFLLGRAAAGSDSKTRSGSWWKARLCRLSFKCIYGYTKTHRAL